MIWSVCLFGDNLIPAYCMFYNCICVISFAKLIILLQYAKVWLKNKAVNLSKYDLSHYFVNERVQNVVESTILSYVFTI